MQKTLPGRGHIRPEGGRDVDVELPLSPHPNQHADRVGVAGDDVDRVVEAGQSRVDDGFTGDERFYLKSLAECPANPLTRAMLVRTLVAEGRPAEAEAQRRKALNQYAAYGWTPNEVKRETKEDMKRELEGTSR